MRHVPDGPDELLDAVIAMVAATIGQRSQCKEPLPVPVSSTALQSANFNGMADS